MVGFAERHGAAPGALAATVGPLADEPAASRLEAADRKRLAGWRDQRWGALELRTGVLAGRDAARSYDALVFERWRDDVDAGGLSPRALDAFYKVKRFIPRSAQLAMRRRLIGRQGRPVFPAWPFESAGSDLIRIAIADALLSRGANAVRFPWFWPNSARAAVALTHDVESADGLARASRVAEWEEEHGFRSSFNVVDDSYPIDVARVNELASRGHEIGCHGVRHDRSLFASRASFEQQLPLLRAAADRFGAVGFRSPATHRVVEWLCELPFSYDCTMPHSDPYEPIPGGTATVWPFFHGDVVELPYTAPQDHTLFNLLGHRDCAAWREQLQRIVASHGLFQTIAHPDAGYLGRETIGSAYRELLRAIARQENLWVALPRDIAKWWQRRHRGLTPRDDGVARWTGSEIEILPDAGNGGPSA